MKKSRKVDIFINDKIHISNCKVSMVKSNSPYIWYKKDTLLVSGFKIDTALRFIRSQDEDTKIEINRAVYKFHSIAKILNDEKNFLMEETVDGRILLNYTTGFIYRIQNINTLEIKLV